MYDHWVAGEFDKARDLHFALHPVTDVIFTETNPAAAKWVLAQAGLIGSGFVRPPLVPLTEAGQATALRLLAAGAAGARRARVATVSRRRRSRDASHALVR